MVHGGKVSAGQGGGKRRPVLDSYGRLSRVPETGELEKIETQLDDNRQVIKRVGGSLGEELSDGLSAWKRNVRRKGWERLLERVESGESDGIVVWHTDRLFRQPRDLERLIDLADKGFTVYSAHGERDVSDPDDRFILWIEVAHAARSSDDTSRRLKRKFARMRANGHGQAGGARRFGFPGYATVPDGKGGWQPQVDDHGERVMVSEQQVASERQAIRDAARAVLAGVSINQVARDWNDAGFRTIPKGLTWNRTGVMYTLKRPALAGLISYEGTIVVRTGEADPILDEATFDRLQALFASRSRGRVHGGKYLATGILRCGRCGTKLSARPVGRRDNPRNEHRAAYFCNKQRRGCGSVFATSRPVDDELRLFVAARLSDPEHAAALASAHSRTSERLDAVRAEIAECEGLQQQLSARLGARKMTLTAFDEANEPLTRDLTRLYAERDTLEQAETPSGPSAVMTPGEVLAEWDAGGLADKRALLTQALGPVRMVIDPARQRHTNIFDIGRLRLIDRDGNTIGRLTGPDSDD